MRPHSWTRWIDRGPVPRTLVTFEAPRGLATHSLTPCPLSLSIKWREMTFFLVVSLAGWLAGWPCEPGVHQAAVVPLWAYADHLSGARLGKECSREESKGGVVWNVPGSHFEFLPSLDTGYNEASSSICICPQPVWGDRCYLFSLGQEGEEGKCFWS